MDYRRTSLEIHERKFLSFGINMKAFQHENILYKKKRKNWETLNFYTFREKNMTKKHFRIKLTSVVEDGN